MNPIFVLYNKQFAKSNKKIFLTIENIKNNPYNVYYTKTNVFLIKTYEVVPYESNINWIIRPRSFGGSGVVKIIEQHQDKLMHQIGCPVNIKKILVNDPAKERQVAIDKSVLTSNVDEILDDPEIDVIIEVMGGIEETKDYLLHAIKNKKHIVTANKDLMALYGSQLLKEATANECDLFYEASVAGGIPIFADLQNGLALTELRR